ncbi:unnamed protein product, partial [marine sediment metagenome]
QYIYVADYNNNRIQIFDKASPYAYVDQFGTQGSNDGEFEKASNVVVDGTYIYTTDWSNNRVQIFDKDTYAFVDKIGKAGGATGSGNGEFNKPAGIFVDSDYIYVADSENDRIQKFDNSSPFAFVSKFGTLGTGDGELNTPYNVGVDSSYIYVADSENARVQIFNKSDNSYSSQFGSEGTEDGEFDTPVGIVVDELLESDTASIRYLGSPIKADAELDFPTGNVDASSTFTYKFSFSDGTNESDVSPVSNDVTTGAS